MMKDYQIYTDTQGYMSVRRWRLNPAKDRSSQFSNIRAHLVPSKKSDCSSVLQQKRKKRTKERKHVLLLFVMLTSAFSFHSKITLLMESHFNPFQSSHLRHIRSLTKYLDLPKSSQN